jgi:hypothetical protein
MLLGGLLTVITTFYSLKSLHGIVGPVDVKSFIKKVRKKL